MKNKTEIKIRFSCVIALVFVYVLLVLLFLFNHRRALIFMFVGLTLCLIPSILLAVGKISLPVFSIKMKESLSRTGEGNAFITRLDAGGIYPFARIEIRYNIFHSIEQDKKHIFTDYFSLFSGSREYTYDISFDYCGIYYIKAEEIRVYDMLGLVCVTLPPVEAHAVVMPNLFDVKVTDEKLALNRQEEDKNDPTKGFDVSEIKELREYRDGDKLSQVHWKLSTKSEDLIVKEYERQAGTCIVIACDASYTGLSDINDYYDFLNSFGNALLKEELYFELVYCDKGESAPVRFNINNTYDFSIAIQGMYYNVIPVSLYELKEFYHENFGRSKLFVLTRENIEGAEFRLIDSKNKFGIYAEI